MQGNRMEMQLQHRDGYPIGINRLHVVAYMPHYFMDEREGTEILTTTGMVYVVKNDFAVVKEMMGK